MSYVFIDLETTGLDSEKCFITEVAAVKTNDYGDVTGMMNYYVELPEGESIPTEIIKLNGITDDDLAKHGVSITSAMTHLERLIGDDVVIAQYAPFDLSFIERHFEVKNFYDTRTMAYELGLPKANLKGLAEHYGIDMGTHHRALDDAKTCAAAFFNLVEDLYATGHEVGTLMNVVGTKPERIPSVLPKNTINVVDYAEKEGE